MSCMPKPFLKWAGGKGQLLSQIEAMLPSNIESAEFSYIEPFVGGGAMLFYMLQRYPNIKKVTINDINRRLIDAYRNIMSHPEILIAELSRIEAEYKSLSSEEAMKEYYLSMRRMFNTKELDSVADRLV